MTRYTVIYRNRENPDRFENHIMYRRDGVYIFEEKSRIGPRKSVEIPMSTVLRVEREG